MGLQYYAVFEVTNGDDMNNLETNFELPTRHRPFHSYFAALTMKTMLMIMMLIKMMLMILMLMKMMLIKMMLMIMMWRRRSVQGMH